VVAIATAEEGGSLAVKEFQAIDKVCFIAKDRDLLDVSLNAFLPSHASTELCSTPRF
jgi:hypothetical protein